MGTMTDDLRSIHTTRGLVKMKEIACLPQSQGSWADFFAHPQRCYLISSECREKCRAAGVQR